MAITADLGGKTALVTGAASGIGLATATRLARCGARVALNHLASDARGREAVARLCDEGLDVISAPGDAAAPGAAEETVGAAIAALGRLDILVNSAGIVRLAEAEAVPDEDWDLTMAINLRAPFLMARAAFPALCAAGAGRIVNLASQAAFVALDRHLAYCTSKAGLLGMTKVLAFEWASHGITVNAISPTVVETELGRKAWAGEVGEAMKRKIPVGRFAQPEEIALAALFLASGGAGMITGANLVVDGGYTIQ